MLFSGGNLNKRHEFQRRGLSNPNFEDALDRALAAFTPGEPTNIWGPTISGPQRHRDGFQLRPLRRS